MDQYSSDINPDPDNPPLTSPQKLNENIARIPPRFLNSLGYINYDQYGNVPWRDNERSEIFLSKKYTSITDFLAIDCETVGVGEPPVKALGRISVVNEYGYCLYDTFVNPMVEISDYATQWSGIRAENIENAPPINSVIKKVAELVKGKTLVGHSIHHDLRVLRVKGYKSIRDTALFFKEMTKSNRCLSLKTLAKEYLNATIQTGEHNSIEDAQATMKLYCTVRENWEKSLQAKKIKFPCGHTEKVPSDADTTTLKCRKKLLKTLPCRHHMTLLCHQSPLTAICTICVAKNKLISQTGPPKEIDVTIAKIPPNFLNSIGLINYDHYGKVPWTEDESSEIFLSPKYKSITPFLGIDCEMVGAGARGHLSTLGRVSIVNEYGYCVYDTFVNPMVQITDYRTKYSGVRAIDVVNAPLKTAVLQRVTELVKGKTLVGHDIANDLRVLYINDHPAIRDTAKYFQQQTKAKQMPSLKELTRDYLNGTIQIGEHSSIEDSQAAMKLYSVYREKWEEYLVSNPSHMDTTKGKSTLPCGHKRKVTAGTDISSLKCDRKVKKYLPCGHQMKAPCQQTPSTVPCNLCVARNKIAIKTEASHSSSSLPTSILSTKFPCRHPRSAVNDPSSKCQVILFETLQCGHRQQCKCGERVVEVKCTTKVRKRLPCGHFKEAECGQNISKDICASLETKTLSCGHVARMECFKFKTYKCHRQQIVVLNCVHKHEVPCTRASHFKCPTSVIKDFPCGHQKKVECYKTLSNLKCDICAQKVSTTTKISLPTPCVSSTSSDNCLPCGHTPIVVSIQPSDNNIRPKRKKKCLVYVTRNLPCGHEKLVQCNKKMSEIKCNENVSKNLECGHEKLSPCHQSPSTLKCDICVRNKLASSPKLCPPAPSVSELPIQNNSPEKLPCGHPPKILAKTQASAAKPKCVVVVTKTFSCGHSIKLKCSKVEGYKCEEMKKIRFPCGHVRKAVCSENVSNLECKRMKKIFLSCGHEQTALCGQNVSKVRCEKNRKVLLICGHEQVSCEQNALKVRCEKNKKVLLICGHEQDVTCGQNALEVKCTTNVVKDLPCGHQTMSHCHQSPSTIRCTFCVEKQLLPCGHSSDVLTSPKNKSKVKCAVAVTKNLPCSHVVTAECHKFTNTYICKEIGNKVLICGHEQQAPCNKNVSVVKCIQLVTKNLPCGHQQKSHCHQRESSIKCNSCIVKNCVSVLLNIQTH